MSLTAPSESRLTTAIGRRLSSVSPAATRPKFKSANFCCPSNRRGVLCLPPAPDSGPLNLSPTKTQMRAPPTSTRYSTSQSCVAPTLTTSDPKRQSRSDGPQSQSQSQASARLLSARQSTPSAMAGLRHRHQNARRRWPTPSDCRGPWRGTGCWSRRGHTLRLDAILGGMRHFCTPPEPSFCVASAGRGILSRTRLGRS